MKKSCLLITFLRFWAFSQQRALKTAAEYPNTTASTPVKIFSPCSNTIRLSACAAIAASDIKLKI